ncbi:MAG: hypothetical protein IKI03_09390 [Clostridia bacterium]|nr:hypothetical protein [Clostridia bacterium]
MQNRFSQIFNGKKAIQTYDLPYVSELLGVSCEAILSAGKCYVPVSSHVTNYDVAFSKDPEVWQSYVEREDKLILNYDEYGKSVLDYAFEFRNYGFLKYLTANGYIKFRDSSDSDFRYDFGADTTIKRRDISHTDVVSAELSYTNKLRMNMLSLAMENVDFSTLDMLRARETPMLHFAAVYSNTPPEPDGYDYSEIVDSIASAPDGVIDYFLTEYSVSRQGSVIPSLFLYQHLGAVIVAMIRNRDPRVNRVIEKAVEHNNKVHTMIKGIYSDAEKIIMDQFKCPKTEAKKMVCTINSFYEKCGVAKVYCYNSNNCLVANVIRADAEVTDAGTMSLLQALNVSCDTVRAVAEKVDR